MLYGIQKVYGSIIFWSKIHGILRKNRRTDRKSEKPEENRRQNVQIISVETDEKLENEQKMA